MTDLPGPVATPIVSEKRTRLFRWVAFALAVVAAALAGALGGLLLVYSTELPQVEDLEHYRPSSITELYDENGTVIGTFALQRRVIARYEDFPKLLREAVISIEDKDFERHSGVDFWRILGAAYRDVASDSRAQGASTLTMQLSRNLFLSPDRKFSRKVQEIMPTVEAASRRTSLSGESSKSTSLGPAEVSLILSSEFKASSASSSSEECAAPMRSGTPSRATRPAASASGRASRLLGL